MSEAAEPGSGKLGTTVHTTQRTFEERLRIHPAIPPLTANYPPPKTFGKKARTRRLPSLPFPSKGLKIESRGGKSSFRGSGAEWTKVRYTSLNGTYKKTK